MPDYQETIKESYPVELIKKNGYCFLVYQNEENEKVILKFNNEELTMTRYTNPKTIMQFHKNEVKEMMIPTPLGRQVFLTKTDFFEFSKDTQSLSLHYQLKQAANGNLMANYQMKVEWH